MLRRPSPALVVASAALIVSLGGAALAAIPARDGDIHACYDRSSGAVEVIDTQHDSFSCARGATRLAWDTTPTQLVSKNGDYRVSVADGGVTLSGPGGTVQLAGPRITVDG